KPIFESTRHFFRIQHATRAARKIPKNFGLRGLDLSPRVGLFDGILEMSDQLAHELDVVIARLGWRIQKSVAELEPVACSDDAAPGDAGQHLQIAQDVALGKTGQYAEMVERGSKAAARKCKSDLSDHHSANGFMGARQQHLEELPDLRHFKWALLV